MSELNFDDFEAIIFDMDGVIVDSEPLWKTAMEEVFSSLGSKLTKTDFQKTVGMRIDQVIRYWKISEKWTDDVYYIENQIVNKMVSLINQNGQPLPGVIETIHHIQKLKTIALASSSPKKLIDEVLQKTQLKQSFHGVYSAEFEEHGKPHPAVFLKAAQELNVFPNKCLVIEDSLTGVIAGKAANMTVVCIPEKTHNPNPKLIIADYHFESMTDFLSAISA